MTCWNTKNAHRNPWLAATKMNKRGIKHQYKCSWLWKATGGFWIPRFKMNVKSKETVQRRLMSTPGMQNVSYMESPERSTFTARRRTVFNLRYGQNLEMFVKNRKCFHWPKAHNKRALFRCELQEPRAMLKGILKCIASKYGADSTHKWV